MTKRTIMKRQYASERTLPPIDGYITPERTTTVDDLDARWAHRGYDGWGFSRFFSTGGNQSGREVCSSRGNIYQEYEGNDGWTYYQFVQYTRLLEVHRDMANYGIPTGTYERICGYLPIFTSPTRLVNAGETDEDGEWR
jgi:hypothetical protein